tara:strand:- start:41 stop:1366 length:1326 start_codon:yes stop_codon:yes gene_type:complete
MHLRYDLEDKFGEIVKSEDGGWHAIEYYDRDGNLTDYLFPTSLTTHLPEKKIQYREDWIARRVSTYENGKLVKLDHYRYAFDMNYNEIMEENLENDRLYHRVIYKYNNDGDTISIKTYDGDNRLSLTTFKYNNKKQLIERKTESSYGRSSVKTYKYDKKGIVMMTYIDDNNRYEKIIKKWNKQGDLIEFLAYDEEEILEEKNIYKYKYNKLDSIISKTTLVYDDWPDNYKTLDTSQCDTIQYLYDNIGNKIECDYLSKTSIKKNKNGVFQKVTCVSKLYREYSGNRVIDEGYNFYSVEYDIIKYYEFESGKLIAEASRPITLKRGFRCIDSVPDTYYLSGYRCIDSVRYDSIVSGAWNGGYYKTYKYNNLSQIIEENTYDYDFHSILREDYIIPEISERAVLSFRHTFEYDKYGNQISKTYYEGELLIPKKLEEKSYIYYE